MARRIVRPREVHGIEVGQGGVFGGLGAFPCSVEVQAFGRSVWLSPRDARELAHALTEAAREVENAA